MLLGILGASMLRYVVMGADFVMWEVFCGDEM